MATLGERIRGAREKKGLMQSELAQLVGVKSGAVISNWENDLNKPNADQLVNLCRALGVTLSYLLDYHNVDVGELSEDEMNLVGNFRALDDTGKEHVKTVLNWENERIASSQEVTAQMPVRIIQYFQKVSAGSGQIIEDDLPPESISIPDIPKFRRAAYALMVSGRSMEPMFYDGELLLIEPTCIVDIGEIGIFSVDGMCYVKKRGERELISLNSEYRNIPLNSEARCMGRVIGKISKRN